VTDAACNNSWMHSKSLGKGDDPRVVCVGLKPRNLPSDLRNQRFIRPLVRLIFKSNDIVYDHCHEDGGFRGWICRKCNMAFGLAQEDPMLLRKMADYIIRYRFRLVS
jgi:hypothetical protein